MLKEYVCDIAKSYEMYNDYKDETELLPNHCYNNVFNITRYIDDEIENKEIKIAYGYVNLKCDASTFVRHCFFVDTENNKVIDPTAHFIHHIDEHTKYVTFKEIDNTDEYFNYLYENELYPSLEHVLAKENNDARIEAMKKDYVFFD